ncbi:queuine tRNA-ribosyltransferase accessory subunit 2-like [Littorina saxatilis]|uniref:Queuine tRNA-ribosyltransferase accessory subunit 2 n=1 Tax=Littorina saxatilis TaxID=31220 RepID=A0AAN9G4Y2_9CAEN
MKFSVEKLVQGSCRLGVLRDVGKLKNQTVETPFCLLYTRGGSVPNLSNDTLGYVQDLPPVALMPLNVLAEHHETVQEYGKGIAEFTVMKDFLVCCTMQDPCTAAPSGYNDKTSVALWGRSGKMKVDPELFVKVQEAFQPDWFQCLGDADTCKTSSKKRTKKAVDNTLNFLDEILSKRKSSQTLQKMALFGSIGGGFSQFERERSAKETVARNVEGFALEGFQNDGEEFCQFGDKDFVDILSLTLKHLPEDKPRMMCAVLRPDVVLQAVRAGIDIFDTSYAYAATEKGHALVFDYNYHTPSEEVKDSDETKMSTPATESGFTINLGDKKYRDDFGPLLAGCKCFTCKTNTRAYINHLNNVTELQQGILLMIHNLHHYLGFFSALRQSLREDKFDQLEALIAQQKPHSPDR